MSTLFLIFGISIFLLILIKPITSIISRAWHKQKFKVIDENLKGEINE